MGLLELPQTLNPYSYARNDPINLSDPSGQFAPLALLLAVGAGALIGGVSAGLNYGWVQPQSCTGNPLLSKGFLDAVAIGVITGAAAGLVGFLTPLLLPAAGFWGTVGVEILSGALEAAVAQIILNHYNGADWHHDVLGAMLAGAVGGAIGGAIGYGLGKIAQRVMGEAPRVQLDDALDIESCFEAGTPVVTTRGSVPIETVQVGDMAWAADPETGQAGYFPVTQAFSRHVESLLEVSIGGELLRVTDEHPFWVADQGWVGAGGLKPGDCVQTMDGGCRPVTSVRLVQADTWVYNFTVAQAHTYYVGESGFLVHNQCQAPLPSQAYIIDDILNNELRGVTFKQGNPPEYVPGFKKDGWATPTGRIWIGPSAFGEGRWNVTITILEEELHHRFRMRGIPSESHHRKMERILVRYAIAKDWHFSSEEVIRLFRGGRK